MYQYAITRRPGPNAGEGETSVELGSPNLPLLMQQHQHYVDTLQSLGVEVTVLDELNDYPDAYFVEDVAIVVPEVAVLTRPGADSRRGEVEFIADSLARLRNLEVISEPGTLDGGDVLIVGRHCVVGLSERTNREGAEMLGEILAGYGYRTDIIDVTEALHFKSNVNFLDEHSLLVTQQSYWLDCLADYRKFVVPEGEEYAANVVWINGSILVSESYDGTCRLLQENGFNTIPMPTSEIEKMDGGLTCLSLRIT